MQLVYSVKINTRGQLLDQITNRFYEIRQDDATIAPVFTTQWFAGVMLAFELKGGILNNCYRQYFSFILIYFSSCLFFKVI
jgi:hypothetical protein